jgi:hypothetical protein
MAPQKQAGVAILISDKIAFKLTLIKWDKGHPILIKGEINQKEIIINLYAPNVNAPNFIKQEGGAVDSGTWPHQTSRA